MNNWTNLLQLEVEDEDYTIENIYIIAERRSEVEKERNQLTILSNTWAIYLTNRI